MTGRDPVSADEPLLAEAALWMERARSGDESDRAAFRRWLSARPEHVAAMDMVERAWRLAPAAARAAGASVRPHVPAGDMQQRNGRLIPAGGAVLAGTIAMLCWFGSIDTMVVTTGPHERRVIALADGTHAWLAPASRLTVRTTPLARSIGVHGEVAFDVHHEWRAFAVDVGTVRTLDRGTLFSVSDRHGVSVLLASGSIAIQDAASGAPIATPAPGQRVDVADGTATVSTVDATDALAWRNGRIVVQNVPLAEVLLRFAEQGSPPVALADPGLGALPVSGSYASDDIKGFLTALATLYPVHWEKTGVGYAVRRHR